MLPMHRHSDWISQMTHNLDRLFWPMTESNCPFLNSKMTKRVRFSSAIVMASRVFIAILIECSSRTVDVVVMLGPTQGRNCWDNQSPQWIITVRLDSLGLACWELKWMAFSSSGTKFWSVGSQTRNPQSLWIWTSQNWTLRCFFLLIKEYLWCVSHGPIHSIHECVVCSAI